MNEEYIEIYPYSLIYGKDYEELMKNEEDDENGSL